MTWAIRHGIKVWDGPDFDEPADDDLKPYMYVATPVEERTHPATCGKGGSGRNAHRRKGTPVCRDCQVAERHYSADRRERDRALAS